MMTLVMGFMAGITIGIVSWGLVQGHPRNETQGSPATATATVYVQPQEGAPRQPPEDSIAERKARSFCRACGQQGHWQDDSVCPASAPSLATPLLEPTAAAPVSSERPAAPVFSELSQPVRRRGPHAGLYVREVGTQSQTSYARWRKEPRFILSSEPTDVGLVHISPCHSD